MFEQNKKQELTSRQQEILTLLRKGLTNNEICKTLKISPNTVKVHLAHIYKILEVTNRTEAVTAGQTTNNVTENTLKDLKVIFNIKKDIPENSKAYNLYLLIIEAIHQYRVFRIEESTEKCEDASFKIEVSSSSEKEDSLYISTRIGHSNELLWNLSIKINTDNLLVLAQKSAIQLFREIILESAKLKHSPNKAIPNWWIETAYCYARLENRSEDSFEICKQILPPFVSGDNYCEVSLYVISLAYYFAIIENWGNIQENSVKLSEFARKAMHSAPYSIYSQIIMALYNITSGSKAEAVAYLKQVIEANPQMVLARTILTQIYMLTGQESLAMELNDDSIQRLPELALQSTYQARAFILLMKGQFEECKTLANQILIFNPKALAVRLIMIACCNILGNTEDCDSHIKALYEYYPNLTIKDVEQLLKGVSEQRKSFFLSKLQKIFT